MDAAGPTTPGEPTVPGTPGSRVRAWSALVVMVVAALVVGVPLLAAAWVPPAPDAPSRPAELEPFAGGGLVVPSGWTLRQPATRAHQPVLWSHGDATLSVQVETVPDAATFGERVARRMLASGDTVGPARALRTRGGFVGTVRDVRDGDGRQGRLAVVAHGAGAVSVVALAPGADAAAAATATGGLDQVLGSLRATP